MDELLTLSRVTKTIENLEGLLAEMQRELGQREADLKWFRAQVDSEAVPYDVGTAAHEAIPEIEESIESLKRAIVAEQEPLDRESRRKSRMQAHAESLNKMARSRPTMYPDFPLQEAAAGTNENGSHAGGRRQMAKARVA